MESTPGGFVPRTACDPAVSGSCYGSGRGLQIYAAPGSYTPYQWGGWVYATTPGRTSYIAEAHYNWLWHNRHGDAANDSVALAWMFNSQTQTFTGVNVPNASVGGYAPVRWGDGGGVAADGPGTNMTAWTLQMPTAATRTAWTDVYAGAAFIILDDPEAPTAAAPSHNVPVSGWHGNGEEITTAAAASDPGLGVKHLNLTRSYAPIEQKTHACAGTRSSPCPTGWSQQFTYSTSQMAEGTNALQLSAYDPPLHLSNVNSWSVKVDRSAPEVALSGAFYDQRDQPLEPGQYALRVDATDGSVASPRSGVKSIEIKVDGITVSGPSPESCPNAQCPYTLGRDWTLDTGEFSGGERTVEVSVKDLLGHTETKSFVVTVQSPETVITSGPSETESVRHAVFEFTSPDPGATFECKLDDNDWAACSSPKYYTSLDSRYHTLNVRSVTLQGFDPSPATHGWLTDYHSPNGRSDEPSLSADGRFVAFSSSAIDFTSGDANSRDDIIVYNLPASGPPTVMERASVSSSGIAANEDSSSPSISSDGRHIAFRSTATNLVSGDTNEAEDIFLRDRVSGTTTRISVATGGAQADDRSYSPAVSADGRYVAFSSDASNLVGTDANGSEDVFVHDRYFNRTTRVSVSESDGSANGYSTSPSISADGRYIAFDSTSSNLVTNDTNGDKDVFVRDLEADTTSRASKSSSGLKATSTARSRQSQLTAPLSRSNRWHSSMAGTQTGEAMYMYAIA